MLEILFWCLVLSLMVFSCWVAWYLPRIRARHMQQVQDLHHRLNTMAGEKLVIEKKNQVLQTENQTLQRVANNYSAEITRLTGKQPGQ